MTRELVASAVLAASLVACGAPDSTLQHRADMPGDHEVGESAGELHANAAATWFPMAEGNEWTFQGEKGTVHTIRVELRDGNLMWVSGLREVPTWFGHSATYPNNLYVWNDEYQGWSYHTRFGFQYTSWIYQPSGACERYQAKRDVTGVRVQTPAGEFSGARTVAYTLLTPKDALCAPRFGMRSITFAPDVGPVRFVSFTTNETFVLTQATIGGKAFPAAPAGVAVRVSSDEATYVNVANTIRCITYPCPSNAVTAEATFTLEVTNNGTTPRTFEFSTGQHFDFELVDANGKVVKAWSDDRGFIQAVTQMTLGAGATKRYTGAVMLEDRDGLQLDGTYTVRARFLAIDAKATALTTIAVTIQQ